MSEGYLLDTNVISEVRKGARCNPGVRAWFDAATTEELWLSVLVIGEIRKGIERIRRRDRPSAARLERWLFGLTTVHERRILPVTLDIAQRWGLLNAEKPIPYVDGFLAATAFERRLTLVTRNISDVASTGIEVLNPFSG